MSITLRNIKGSPLTHQEMDENFSALTSSLGAGGGLTGGGLLTSEVTFNVGQGDGISVTSDAVGVNSTVARTGSNSFTADQTITGSLTATGDVEGNTFTVNDTIIVDESRNFTGSNASFTGIVTSSISDAISGSFDRLDVSGNSKVDGDLNVIGKVTAQEFHTEFVSASIIFQSGSTKFGDTLDDIHDFTGSLNSTGSLSIIGTSTFTGNIDQNGNLYVIGDITGSSNLDIAGTVDANVYSSNGTTVVDSSRNITGSAGTFSGNVDVANLDSTGNVDANTFSTNGSTVINSSQDITGASLDVTGEVEGNTFAVDGITIVDASRNFTGSSAYLSGNLEVAGNTDIDGTLFVGEDVTVEGIVTSNSNTRFGNEPLIDTHIFQGDTTVTGSFRVGKVELNDQEISTLSGNLEINPSQVVDFKTDVTASATNFTIDHTGTGTFTLTTTGVDNDLILNSTNKVHLSQSISLQLEKNIRSKQYFSGFAGSGLAIDNNGIGTSAEFDDLTVRGSMRVFELLINQVRATNGSLFISSVGKVDSVEDLGGGNFGLVFDTGSGLLGHGFTNNDVIRAQRVNRNAIANAGVTQSLDGNLVYRSDLTVTNVQDLRILTASLQPGSTPPSSSFEYVRLGNSTDVNRQGNVYLTSDDNYAPFIDIVDGITSHSDWNVASGSGGVKVRLGKLDGVSSPQFGDLEGYGMWASGSVFLEGSINATSGKIADLSINSEEIFSGNGNFANSDTQFYVNKTGSFSLGDKLFWDGSTLNLEGNISATSGEVSDRLSSLETTSGSILLSIDTINQETGSLQSSINLNSSSIISIVAFTGSAETRFASIEQTTGSVELSVAALNINSGSTESRLSSIELTTGSIELAVQELNNETGSLQSSITLNANSISSIVEFTSSAESRFSSIELTTGSIELSVTALNIESGSTNTRLSSIELTTGSINLSVSALNSETGSLQSSINLNTNSISSIVEFTSSAESRFSSIELTTGSIELSVTALNIESGSTNTRLSSIELTTGSIELSVAALNSETGSLQSSININEGAITSLTAFTSSAESRFSSIEQTTGSINLSVSALNSTSGSTLDRLSSIELTTGSIELRVSDTEATSSNVASLAINKQGVQITGSVLEFKGDSFFFGNPSQFISGSNGNLRFESTNFTVAQNGDVAITGDITANTGNIGGFNLSGDALAGSNFYLSGSATGNEFFISSSNFNVKANGDVTASNADLTGNITATNITAVNQGNIAGFTLTSNQLSDSGNNLVLKSNGQISGSNVLFTGGKISGSAIEFDVTNFVAKGDTVEISGSSFHLLNGNITASNVDLSGNINAQTGTIGGFSISSDTLAGSNFYLSGSATGNEFFISSSNFNVKANGDVTGSNSLFIDSVLEGISDADAFIFNILKIDDTNQSNYLKLTNAGGNRYVLDLSGGTPGSAQFIRFEASITPNPLIITHIIPPKNDNSKGFRVVLEGTADNRIQLERFASSTTLNGSTINFDGTTNVDQAFDIGNDVNEFFRFDSNGLFVIKSGERVDLVKSLFDYKIQSTTRPKGINVSGSITGSGLLLSSGINVSGDITGSGLQLSSLPVLSFGTTALFLGINNDVSTRVLNTNAFTSAITVGTGLDIANATTAPTISLDLTEITLSNGLDSTATGLSLDLTEVGFGVGANRIITNDGDGTVTAEANLTYDGTNLTNTGGSYIVDIANTNISVLRGEDTNGNGILMGVDVTGDFYMAPINTGTVDFADELRVISGLGWKVEQSFGVGVNPNATNGRIDASNDIVAFSSDRRLKENIQLITNPLDKINSLSGFTYTWNGLANKLANFETGSRYVGVFAQDVESVLPEAIKPAPFDNDGYNNSISGENYLTVQYEKLVPLLIEGMKEQQKEIQELKGLVNQLLGKNNG